MTKDEKIKGHFSAMAECTGNLRRNFDPKRVVENDEVAQYLQKQLDAIEKLLQVPESPEDSKKLTGRCEMTTKQEQIKDHLRAIAGAARCSPYAWGITFEEVAQHIRRHLDAIKEILEENEPETLASSVLRLTNICNALERENATLRTDLIDMTLSFNMAEKYASALKADLDNKSRLYLETDKELDVVVRSNAWLRARHTAEDHLRKQVSALQVTVAKLKGELKQFRIGWCPYDCASREQLAELRAEIAQQNKYIELLKNENRRTLQGARQ